MAGAADLPRVVPRCVPAEKAVEQIGTATLLHKEVAEVTLRSDTVLLGKIQTPAAGATEVLKELRLAVRLIKMFALAAIVPTSVETRVSGVAA